MLLTENLWRGSNQIDTFVKPSVRRIVFIALELFGVASILVNDAAEGYTNLNFHLIILPENKKS